MPDTILEKEPHSKFSEYPKKMDDYFQKNTITIRIVPDSLDPSIEKVVTNFQITSATQYANYLQEELKFWKENDPKEKLKDFVKKQALYNALSNFETAHTHYEKYPTSSSADYYMDQSIAAIRTGTLYSKSALAHYLLSLLDKGPEFFSGFRYGLIVSKSTSFSVCVGSLEGFLAALEYRRFINELNLSCSVDVQLFKENVSDANKRYAELLQSYTSAFHDQEARLKDIVSQTNQHMSKLHDDCSLYFKERESMCSDLENLYREKLRLEAPAEYWKELDAQYSKAEWIWFTISVLLAIGIIATLICTLQYIPNLFSKNSHWIDIFKNSAIITVITSISVYILRLFVKMTTSSFHLSRDAKERNKLTYFYLSLIEKKAVTEKERAIILNSLFSRADTGLLKGDSAPTMSGNITDLANQIGVK